jgi:chaperonin cofactor prefoldin
MDEPLRKVTMDHLSELLAHKQRQIDAATTDPRFIATPSLGYESVQAELDALRQGAEELRTLKGERGGTTQQDGFHSVVESLEEELEGETGLCSVSQSLKQQNETIASELNTLKKKMKTLTLKSQTLKDELGGKAGQAGLRSVNKSLKQQNETLTLELAALKEELQATKGELRRVAGGEGRSAGGDRRPEPMS